MSVYLGPNFTSATPLTHARIGYQQVITGATATSSAAGFLALATLTPQTYERWMPTASPATITFTFPGRVINYIGIGAHTLSLADSVELEILQDGNWIPQTLTISGGKSASLILDFLNQQYLVQGTISDSDDANLILLAPTFCQGFRFIITYSAGAPSIAYVSAGNVLEMERPFYRGHTPAQLTADIVSRPNVSEGGEWLGRSLIRKGRSTSMQWQNLSAQWYRSNFDQFRVHAQSGTFFVAWNPAQYGTDVLYAHTDDDIRPTHSGFRDKLSVSMNVKGYLQR
jgi:hypothetical protein